MFKLFFIEIKTFSFASLQVDTGFLEDIRKSQRTLHASKFPNVASDVCV